MIVLASLNEGKIREFKSLLGPKLLSIFDLDPKFQLPEETGGSYHENAYLKARAVAERFKLPSLADDSGFEVEALGGRPGLYSARYGGKELSFSERIELLLNEMKNVTDRKAAFVCVLCLVLPESFEPEYFEGRVQGRLLLEARGSMGFGYDPVFQANSMDKSFAEISEELKSQISHRAKAIEAANSRIQDLIASAPSAAQSGLDHSH
ncbi:MAG: RdgB/HAM1 family non-canonical purine NTP pyrophosphatase [Bradymonadales bacterium]|nr:MAG: RdgB/HAM1 family non-canonical purine NTP pyrophosphatase [Bradymonadales bacterium]